MATANTPFNATRKAERERIAEFLINAAAKHGATVSRRDDGPNLGYRGPAIILTLTLGGVAANVSISNLHGGDYGLISWYNSGLDVRNFSTSFNHAVGETNHPRGHHKATSCGTWEVLAARLSAGFRRAAKGVAFVEK